MHKHKVHRLKALAKILSNMTEDDAMNILCDMEGAFRVDRKSLNYLAVSMFRPDEIFEKADRKGLSSLLSEMSLDSLSTLIDVLDEKNKNLCADIIGDRRFKDAVDISRKPSRSDMISEMLKVMALKISAGKLSYKGPALFLMEIPCRPSLELKEEKDEVFFSVLNPVVSKDEGVRVLLYNPFQTQGELKLSFQQKGERYFNRRSWLMPVLTDDNGFYYGELFPDRQPGMNTLWLEIPGKGQAERNLYFTDSSRSVFSIMVNRVDIHAHGRCSVSFSLPGLEKSVDYARVKFFCTKCGHPLAAAGVKLEKNSGKVEFNLAPDSGHCDDLFMHIEAGKHQACTAINTGSGMRTSIEPVLEKDRNPGSSISIDLPVEPGEVFMYHVSSSMQADVEASQRILSGDRLLHGRIKYPGDRMSSVLELSEADGGLFVMPSRDTVKGLKFDSLNSRDSFSYQSQGRENYFDLYLTFYRLSPSGPVMFYRYVSYVDRSVRVYPVLPSYLEEGESAEVDIMYRSEKEMRVSLTNGGTSNTMVKGSGIIRSRFSYGHEYTLACNGGGDPYSRLITIPERGEIIGWNRIEYIPPGTIIEPDRDTNYTIYRSPMELLEEIRTRMLLVYLWGCAEQTAAKLSAMCWLFFSGTSPWPRLKLLVLIRNGIKKLLTYRKTDGMYSLWGRDASITVTMAILRHLMPLMRFRDKLAGDLPEIMQIIDNLLQVCGNTAVNSSNDVIPFNFGRDLKLSLYLDESPYLTSIDTGRLIGDAAENLKYENGRFFHTVSGGMMSQPAYLSYLAASLIENGESSVEAVVSRRKTVDEIHRSGIAGLLELLGLLERKTRTRFSSETSVINDAVEPLLRSILFTYMASSSMSTIDMQALISLLSVIERISPVYSYASAASKSVPASYGSIDAPVRVESGYTFVKKSFTKKTDGRSGSITAGLTAARTGKGGTVLLKIDNEKSAHFVYTIYYPAVLEPAIISGMIHDEQAVRIDSASLERNGGLLFTATRRGRGRVRVLHENMYDTSSADVIDAGWIEVE